MEVSPPKLQGCFMVKNNRVVTCEGKPATFAQLSSLEDFVERMRLGVMQGVVSLFPQEYVDQAAEQIQDNDVLEETLDSTAEFEGRTNPRAANMLQGRTMPENISMLTGEEDDNDDVDGFVGHTFTGVSSKGIPIDNNRDHLTPWEKEKLVSTGLAGEQKVGHEAVLMSELHPSNLTKPRFLPNTEYHDWAQANSFEVPRYPTYAFGEQSHWNENEGAF